MRPGSCANLNYNPQALQIKSGACVSSDQSSHLTAVPAPNDLPKLSEWLWSDVGDPSQVPTRILTLLPDGTGRQMGGARRKRTFISVHQVIREERAQPNEYKPIAGEGTADGERRQALLLGPQVW